MLYFDHTRFAGFWIEWKQKQKIVVFTKNYQMLNVLRKIKEKDKKLTSPKVLRTDGYRKLGS